MDNYTPLFMINCSFANLKLKGLGAAIPPDTQWILGFLSPGIPFREAAVYIKNQCGSIPVVLTSTAGELCSLSDKGRSPLYHDSDETRDNLVLQFYSSEIIKNMEIHTVELYPVSLSPGERKEHIQKEIEKISPSFVINHHNCIAYTLVDGLSNGESFFMEALYDSGNLPCLFIGGSSGGKLDFKESYIFDNKQVQTNKAVICLLQLNDSVKPGIFKSQNFKRCPYSFTVGQANPGERYIKTVVNRKTGHIRDAIEELCEYFKCSENQLEKELTRYSFAIVIDDDIYVRSIASFDFENRRIYFYCDLAFGDELHLVEHTDFVSSIENDFNKFMKNKKGQLLGGLFNDCILRRLINQQSLGRVHIFDQIPVGGFSTFGELLGVNINQTLTALMFFKVEPGQNFHDEYLDNFIQRYSAFKDFFLHRTINQLKQIDRIKTRAWNQSREQITSLAELIDLSSNKAIENETLLEQIHNDFSGLNQSIDHSSEMGIQISSELLDLHTVAQTVVKILRDIEDIAGRTGLLGFNASIEAARAGNAGKGFAIIAREVKDLADKTDNSAKDTHDSVKKLIDNMELLKEQCDIITSAQSEARKTGELLSGHIKSLADNSSIIEQTIAGNSDKIHSVISSLDEILAIVESF